MRSLILGASVFATLALAAPVAPAGSMEPVPPALRTAHSALSTRHAAPRTPHPALRTPHSAPVQPLGAIRGRLDIRTVARPVERRPEVAESGSGVREPQDLRRGVVYLETAPRGAFEEREPGRAVLDQRNETFVPHVLAVMVGTVVDFPNSDKTYHNVFSLSKPKRFDLGRYATGRSKSVKFDRPGVVRVFCDIHSHMNAFVLVFSHPFFDVTDLDGRFRLDHVPAGTYTVVAWYESGAQTSRVVTVPAGGVVDVELVVQ